MNREAFEASYASSHDLPLETFSQYRMGDTYRLPAIASHWRTWQMAIESVVVELQEENKMLRQVMSAVTSEVPRGEYIKPGNAPGHCHEIPGVWDRGNGEKSGKECGWCKVWNAAIDMSRSE
ncbi:hypothetical protein D3C85_965730 [compost metagenome]